MPCSDPTSRVILLLDLDCFYAQCECVRLGLDSRNTPLALLQWNSVLAVTYPAREQFQIKRGDGWQQVQDKSDGGKCHAVHVLLLKTNDEETPDESHSNHPNNYLDTAAPTETYESVFHASPEEQEKARKNDIGKRQYSHQGKASLERYRMASAQIFAKVHECIQNFPFAPSNSIVLERASIDEFFLDVTKAVEDDQQDWSGVTESVQSTRTIRDESASMNETGIETALAEADEGDPNNDAVVDRETTTLQRGCWIAQQIRDYIWNTLSFTLSCGIGVNKTLAKLSASYGKPNGQAILYPRHTPFLLRKTPIHKCRNLGGKIGNTVKSLLPADAPATVASISQYLSLPELAQHLGTDTARWVYDAAQGIDYQSVQAKDTQSSTALTKSITSFKSLPFQKGAYRLVDATKWIRLLATDVTMRVDKDAQEHGRYPKSCTIQYHPPFLGQRGELSREQKRQHIYSNKSVRVAFPPQRLSHEEKVNLLVEAVLDKVGRERKVDRIGMAAMEFQPTAAIGMSSMDRFLRTVDDSTGDRSPPISQNKSAEKSRHREFEAANIPTETWNQHGDTDRALAEKMQAEFDRERRLLEAADRVRKPSGTTSNKRLKTIDSFFGKKK